MLQATGQEERTKLNKQKKIGKSASAADKKLSTKEEKKRLRKLQEQEEKREEREAKEDEEAYQNVSIF